MNDTSHEDNKEMSSAVCAGFFSNAFRQEFVKGCTFVMHVNLKCNTTKRSTSSCFQHSVGFY